jgi:hypothetical protein
MKAAAADERMAVGSTVSAARLTRTATAAAGRLCAQALPPAQTGAAWLQRTAEALLLKIRSIGTTEAAAQEQHPVASRSATAAAVNWEQHRRWE